MNKRFKEFLKLLFSGKKSELRDMGMQGAGSKGLFVVDKKKYNKKK